MTGPKDTTPRWRRRTALGAAAGLYVAGCGDDATDPSPPAPTPTSTPPCNEVVQSLLDERGDPFEPLAHWLREGVAEEQLYAAALEVGARLMAPHGDLHVVLGVGAARVLADHVHDEHRLMPLFRTWFDQFELVWDEPGTQSVLPELGSLPAASDDALVQAWEDWDEDAADAAIVALYRDGGRDAVLALLTLYGQRNHEWVGHTTIWTGHALRTLDAFGWSCAEPVLRSLARAIAANPDQARADAFYANLDRLGSMPNDWQQGDDDPARVPELMAVLRDGDATTCVDAVWSALEDGVSPRTLWTALDLVAVELAIRWQHPSWGVHELDANNAFRHLQQVTPDPVAELLALLQAAAWRPEFQSFVTPDPPVIADTLDDFAPASSALDLESALELIGGDGETAARALAAYFDGGGTVDEVTRRWADVIAKHAEQDVHHQKYHVALIEETEAALPEWREALLLGITMRAPLVGGAAWPRYEDASDIIASL